MMKRHKVKITSFFSMVFALFFLFFIPSWLEAKTLVFSNEQAQTTADGSFVIDTQDYENNIQLKFGNSIDAAIIFERVANVFKVNRALDLNDNELLNVRLEQQSNAPLCDATKIGKIYFNTTSLKSYACNGLTWSQLDNDTSVTGGASLEPFITTTNQVTHAGLTTQDVVLEGLNFTSSTTVEIPGFDGTINSVSVLSPTALSVNLSHSNTTRRYSFVLKNGDLSNQNWATPNGVDLLYVEGSNVIPVTDCSNGAQANSCSTLIGQTVVSGSYCLDTDGSSGADPYLVYCDMETDGGGWSRVVRTTGNNTDFGQKTHAYSYVEVTATEGIYATYANVKDFSKVMIKQVSSTDFAAYDLVSSSNGESIYDLMTYCKNQSGAPKNDTIWDGARVKGMTSEYSGTKYEGTFNYDYFFMCGVNESSDNDQAYMSFSDSTGSSNAWNDSWRGTNQSGTLWSLLNGDYYNTNTGRHIGNGYSQANAGYKGSNNGTYEVYIK